MENNILTAKELKDLVERSVAFFPDPDLDALVIKHLAKGEMPEKLVPELSEHEYIYKTGADSYDLTIEAEAHLVENYPKEWEDAKRVARGAK